MSLFYISWTVLGCYIEILMSDVKSELTTDVDMFQFIDKGVRGGISYVSNIIVTPPTIETHWDKASCIFFSHVDIWFRRVETDFTTDLEGFINFPANFTAKLNRGWIF